MKKKLCLIRHAKSNWEHPEIQDLDRTLDSRGEMDATLMGAFLKEKKINPDYVMSSQALRALSTAKLIAAAVNFPEDKVTINSNIYEAGVEELLEVIKNLPSKFKTVIVVGHNPGLTWLANYLAEDHLINLPTCGIYCMEFDTNDWKKITEVEGRTLFFETPQGH